MALGVWQRSGLKSSETRAGPLRRAPHAARLVQLLTSRIVTQEKNSSCPLGKKEGHVITRYVLQPAGAAPQAHTHNTVNRNAGTAGRRGSLRPTRSLKHSAAPEKPNKKITLNFKNVCTAGALVRAAGAGWGGPLFPFCLQVSGALGAAPAGQDRVPRPPVSLKARPVFGCWVLVSVTAPCQPVRPWLK